MSTIYSWEITHNKETNDFNGHNAQQFIITLGTEEKAGEIEGILEQLFEKLMEEDKIIMCGDHLVPVKDCGCLL